MVLRVVAILLVGWSALLPAAAASADPGRGRGAIPGPGCLEDGAEPTVVTADVVLRRDLRCERLMWVLAPGVTVDLGQHRVVVDEHLDCVRFLFDGCNIDVGGGTLTNGSVAGASVRIGGGTVTGVHVRDGDVGLTRPVGGASGRSAIEASILQGGVVMFEGAGGRVERSWIVHGDGVVLHNSERGVGGFEIRDSVIAGNRGAGISNIGRVHFEDDVSGTIEHNLLVANEREGIGFFGVTTSLGAIEIRRNVALGNGGTGIAIDHDPSAVPYQGGPVSIGDNITAFNGGHGIDAAGGADGSVDVVDDGGNRALANAAAPACVGVACS
jgi:hypothetical protein